MTAGGAHTAASTLTIAAAQYPLDPVASVDAWQSKVRRWVEDGAATGAEILVFPEYAALELAATGGSAVAASLSESLHHVAAMRDMRVETYQSLAQEFNVTLLAGSGPVASPDGGFYNAAQLITAQGRVGQQEKLIMTPFERKWGISPGQQISVFKTERITIAILICYDVEFPLLARAAASHGAELLLVPSCTEQVSGFNRVKIGARARALENTVASVQSPTVGDAVWSPAVDYNSGAGGIYVPAEQTMSETGIIAEGTLNQPGWVTGTVDLAKLRALRATGEMRNYNDWSLQPGANDHAVSVNCIDLT